MAHHGLTLKRNIRGNSFELPLAVHPLENGVIIINYPGFTGDIDGYNDKYRQLGDILQEEKVGAVVRMGNPYFNPYPQIMLSNLRRVIRYSIQHGQELAGTENPHLYLMGFSAGASAIAAVAPDYSPIEKILLISPAMDAGEKEVRRGLRHYTGELYIVSGENDEVVGPDVAPIMIGNAVGTKRRTLEVIPGCDHQFRGMRNGQILSKAPLWAFAGEKTFPWPDGGRVLYQ